MAKRKCRMTEHELDVHKRAVALRKMTDEQLVNKVDGKNEFSAVVNIEACGKREKESHSDIEKFLTELKEGNCKGIGKVTAEKLFSYCIDKGYAKFGMKEV